MKAEIIKVLKDICADFQSSDKTILVNGKNGGELARYARKPTLDEFITYYELPKEKWKPKVSEVYYRFDSGLEVGTSSWNSDSLDEERFENGNCFQTREEAQVAADKIKELLKTL